MKSYTKHFDITLNRGCTRDTFITNKNFSQNKIKKMNRTYSHRATTSCQGDLEEIQAMPYLPFCLTAFGAKSELFYHDETVSLYHHSYLLRHQQIVVRFIHSQQLLVVFFSALKKAGAARSVGLFALAWQAGYFVPRNAPPCTARKAPIPRAGIFCLYAYDLGQKGRDSPLDVIKTVLKLRYNQIL